MSLCLLTAVYAVLSVVVVFAPMWTLRTVTAVIRGQNEALNAQEATDSNSRVEVAGA